MAGKTYCSMSAMGLSVTVRENMGEQTDKQSILQTESVCLCMSIFKEGYGGFVEAVKVVDKEVR